MSTHPLFTLFSSTLLLLAFVVIRMLRRQIASLERELKESRQDTLNLQAENHRLFKAMLDKTL